MKMMAAKDVPFCAESQISNINVGELDEMRKTLIDCGCPLWRIQITTPTGRMKAMENLVLSRDNYMALVRKMIEYRRDQSDIVIDVGENIGYYGCSGTELWSNVPYLGCYAGTRVVGIESNGTIKGCLSMPETHVEGNIRDSSFTEIWNNPDGFAYNRKFKRETARGFCHDCKYLPLCRGGCATTSVAASGCRADNPYCTYRIEQEMGIPAPPDTEFVTGLLDRFSPAAVKG
jgi:radical SAM protein with 4Fe4S-binding SPASM domain